MEGDAVIYLLDESSKPATADPWTAGYHFRQADGVPTAHVYVKEGDLTEWTLCLSHETLELIAHPFVNLYVRGPHPDPRVDREVFHSYEVCDAVMEEFYYVDGKKVSNFLLPLYFTRGGHDVGRVVFRDREYCKPLESFGLNPGGYIPYHDPKKGRSFHYHLVQCEDGRYKPQTFESAEMAQYRPWPFERREAETASD